MARRGTVLKEQLAGLSSDLYNLLEGHSFYQQSLIALIDDNIESEDWLIGAMVIQQGLRQSGDKLINQFIQTQQFSR